MLYALEVHKLYSGVHNSRLYRGGWGLVVFSPLATSSSDSLSVSFIVSPVIITDRLNTLFIGGKLSAGHLILYGTYIYQWTFF
jgi:hypothetical protein